MRRKVNRVEHIFLNATVSLLCPLDKYWQKYSCLKFPSFWLALGYYDVAPGWFSLRHGSEKQVSLNKRPTNAWECRSNNRHGVYSMRRFQKWHSHLDRSSFEGVRKRLKSELLVISTKIAIFIMTITIDMWYGGSDRGNWMCRFQKSSPCNDQSWFGWGIIGKAQNCLRIAVIGCQVTEFGQN